MAVSEPEATNLPGNLETIEVDLLCEGIYRRYGFDFRHYARASVVRRITDFMEKEDIKTFSDVQSMVLHSRSHMERLLTYLSVSVTSMFRDPEMFARFRKDVVPILRTYPSIRIWHAGCASGEEAYSLAILLEEEGLADKCRIYATDFSETALKRAKAGIYPLSAMREFTENYQKSGGSSTFSGYYNARYDRAIMMPRLRKQIVFSRHNLVTDSSFNEFNVIFCRNVLIYFDQNLQEHVCQLLHESLCRFGVLVLGTSESIEYGSLGKKFKTLDQTQRIYQRIA